MTLEDAITKYRECWVATHYVENIVCQSPEPDEPSAWDDMMAVEPPMSPAEVADIIRSEFVPFTGNPKAEEYSKFAREQMDHPKFLTYIAGRMGAV